MKDKDSEVLIKPRVYKAAIEAAKLTNQKVSEFIEEAINNQIDVSDERKQLAILEKELEVINRRTKIVRDRAYERLNKLEEELGFYKEKYNDSAESLREVRNKYSDTSEELQDKSDKVIQLKKELGSYKEKYNHAYYSLEELKDKFEKLESDLRSKSNKLERDEEELSGLKEKYNQVSKDFEELKEKYSKNKDKLSKSLKNLEELESSLSEYELKNKQKSKIIKKLKDENKQTKTELRDKEDRIISLEKDITYFRDKYLEYLEDNKEYTLRELFNEAIKDKKQLKKYIKKCEELSSNFKKKYQFLSHKLPLGVIIVKSNKILFINEYLNNLLREKSNLSKLSKLFSKKSFKKLKKFLKKEEFSNNIDLEAKVNDETIRFQTSILKITYSGNPAYMLILRDKFEKKSEPDSQINEAERVLKDKDRQVTQLNKILEEKTKEIESLRKEKPSEEKEPKELPPIKKPEETKTKIKNTKVQNVRVPKYSLIILTDNKGEISSINSQVTSQLGYSLKDFIKENEIDSTSMMEITATSKDKEKLKTWFKEIDLSRKPVFNEIFLKDKQGKKKKYSIMMELIVDVDKEPIGIVNILSPTAK